MTSIKVSELPTINTPYNGSEYTLGIQNDESVKVPAPTAMDSATAQAGTSTTAQTVSASVLQSIGYVGSGEGAIIRTIKNKLNTLILNGDYSTASQAKVVGGANPATIYNTLTINRDTVIEGMTVTGSMSGASIFMRAYTDTTSFQSTTTGAYTSYDTTALIGNGITDPHYNHSYGYEARHIFQGANGIDNIFGFYSGITVNGSAGTSSFAAINCFGFMCGDAQGTGTILNQTAFYCNDLTRGASNYAAYFGVTAGVNKYNIYAIGTAQNYFKGNTTIDGALTFNSGATMGGSTKINVTGLSGFHIDTNTNLIIHGGGTLTSISALNDANNAYNPLLINASVIAPNTYIRRKTYTSANIPTASSAGVGAVAFVTDATVSTFYSIYIGGGTISVPVFSDGTDWRIG